MLSSALQTGQIQPIFRKQFNPLRTLPPNLRLQREWDLSTRSLKPVLLKTSACSKPGLTGDNSNKEDKGRGGKQSWKSLSGIKYIGLLILTTAAIMFVRKWGNRSVPYSSFLDKISAKEVEKVVVDGAVLKFQLKQKMGSDENKKIKKTIVYTTKRPDNAKIPYKVMQEHDVEFWSHDNKSYRRLLKYATIAGLCLKVVNYLSIKFLKKRSGREDNSGKKIMFSDVAGVDEAKEELQEIVEFLRNPDRYTRLGARHPRGVLLVGRPGTGKTLLAKAVAGEAGVPFIACSASEFVELFAGMGALNVRNIFARAKKKAPSIIFIDEIDAVGKSRGASDETNDEREQTLNQLLTEMDGFDSSSTVIVLAATNRADVLDEALCRPGRFDRLVMVEAPDSNGRQSILNVLVSKKVIPLGIDVDLAHIASITNGFTGAELANMINEAALLAGRQNKASVEKIDFINAVERSIAGIEKKSSRLAGREKANVACHEAGHAIVHTAVSRIISGQPSVEKLSIQPRSGGVLGFTFMSPTTKDKHLSFVDELRGSLVGLLGGRAAEQVLFPDRVSTGAVDDLHRATKMAHGIVAEYGLHLAVGPISMSTLTNVGGDSMDQGHLGDLVQREVKSMLQSALNVAICLMRANLTVLEGLSARLEEKEKLEGDELQEWLNLVIAPFELAEFVRGKQENNPLQTASESSQEQRPNYYF